MRLDSRARRRLRAVALIPVLAAVGLWWGPTAVSAYTSSLVRYPYVSEMVGNSATLNWATDRSAESGSATWGQVTDGSCTPSHAVAATSTAISIGATAAYQWTADLHFPAAGSYCYRVELGGTDLLGPDPSPEVSTAATQSHFSFAVVGDSGGDTTGEADVMSQIGKSPASFVVSTGDTDNLSGSQTDYGSLSQGTVFPSRYLPMIGSRPIFAAQGNHGFTTNLPYLQNFPARLAAEASGGRNLQESYCCISTLSGPKNYASSWYAFDWGGARFYVLEAAWADAEGAYEGDYLAHWNGPVAGCGPCGAELAWLKADLAAHASTPLKFAFFHYPLHSDSTSQPSDTYLSGVGHLEGLLADNNVDVVFNGHAHIYERNYPEIPGKPMVSYITGGGGAALGTVGACSSFDAYAIGSGSSCHAPKPSSDAQVYEFLLVTVNGDQVTVSPTDSTGQVFDEQTYTFATTPTTVIDTSPPPLTNQTNATFSFHATGSVSGFTCSLDKGPAVACVSPVTYSGLSEGDHEFTVTAPGATPATAGWTIDTSPPSVPSGLSGIATSSEVTLAWSASSDNTGVSGYDIYRDGTLLKTTSGTATTFTDSGLQPATTYAYAVAARDGAGNRSGLSAPLSVTTQAAAAGPALVQSASSSTKTVTLSSPSRAGDLLVLSASLYTGATQPITAVSDGKNTWRKIGAYYSSGHYSEGELWYAPNATGVQTITVTTAASSVALQVEEFSGMVATNPLDKATGASSTGTSASSGAVTPSAGGELAVGFVGGHSSSQAITVTSPGYTLERQQTTTSPSTTSVVTGYKVLSSSAAESFTGRFQSSMYWAAGIALFKAAGAPSATTVIDTSPPPLTAVLLPLGTPGERACNRPLAPREAVRHPIA